MDILVPDRAAAIEALESAGCRVLPDLEYTLDVRGIGTLGRMFGLLRNLNEGPFANDALEVLVRPTLELPANREIAEMLRSRSATYTPVSKPITRRVIKAAAPLHLPFRFGNRDMSLFDAFVSAGVKLPCTVCYLRTVEIDTDGDEPVWRMKRVKSFPFGTDAGGTWLRPLYDDVLDPACGLLIEATWRV